MNDRRWMAVGALAVAMLAWSIAVAEDQMERRGGKWVRVKPAEPGTPAGDVAVIREHFESGRRRSAVKAAKKFLKAYPDSPSREEAMLLAGQAQFDRGRYFQAYEWYEKQLTEFPRGEHYERALDRECKVAEKFLAGRPRIIWGFIRLPARDEGIEILSGVAEHAPGSTFADRSLMRIGDYHYDRRDYPEAVDAYDHYVRMFGRTPRTPYARLQAGQALFESYRGPEHDGTPLLEAQQRLRTYATAYPARATQANVTEMLEQITDQRAEKLYHTGRFYERVSRPKAAAFYYRLVRKDYPQTRWAEQAEEDLARFGQAQQRKAKAGQRNRTLELLNRLFKGSDDEAKTSTRPADSKEEGGSKP